MTIESLELGLPVIAPKHCGFADAITEGCGVLIPVTTPQQYLSQTAMAIETIAKDEALRVALAQGALERAASYDWTRKVDELSAIYEMKLVEESLRVAGTIW